MKMRAHRLYEGAVGLLAAATTMYIVCFLRTVTTFLHISSVLQINIDISLLERAAGFADTAEYLEVFFFTVYAFKEAQLQYNC